MRASSVFQARLFAAAAAIVLLTSACSADSDPTQDPASAADTQAPAAQTDTNTDAAPEDVLEVLDDALAGPDADGDDDRVFGATEDMVIQAVESTFDKYNAKAEWAGTTLRVSMDGSVDDVAAAINCTALNALLADGENAVQVFGDGELDCDDPYGQN